MGWIIFFLALAWLIFRTNVSPYLVVPLAIVIAIVGETVLEIFLRGLMSYRHEPHLGGYREEEEAESRRYALLKAAMQGLFGKPERPETGRGIPEEVEEKAYKQALERVETRSPAPSSVPPPTQHQPTEGDWLKTPEGQDYISWRYGEFSTGADTPAAEIEGRVVPRKTQEPPADLGGQGFQRGWSCPTCGSPGKTTLWQGDEVVRECVNGHRSVLATAAERAWSQEAHQTPHASRGSATGPPLHRAEPPRVPAHDVAYPQTREELLTYLEYLLRSSRPRRRQKWLYVLDFLRHAKEDSEWQRLVDALEKKRPDLIRGKPKEVIDKLMKELREEWLQ